MSENRKASNISASAHEYWKMEPDVYVAPFSDLISTFFADKFPDTSISKNSAALLAPPVSLLSHSKYPPYNIFKEDDQVVVEIAVAGFKRSELSVTLTTTPDGQEEVLVTGKKEVSDKSSTRVYQHQGLAAREFKQRFRLGAYEIIDSVTHEDGILRITTKQKRVEEPAVKVLTIK